MLHEIGHLIWNKLNDQQINNWLNLTKNKKENQVELFCQFYANNYSKNKLEKYKDKNLINFVKKLDKTSNI